MPVAIPRYSQVAKSAIDLFLPEGYSLVFFFEDTNSEIFYERLLRNLFPNIAPFKVISLHGKENVFKKAKGPRVPGLAYLFVVDKDFDDLLNKVFVHNDVFYLEKYSIENFLIDLPALVRVVVEEFPGTISEQLATHNCADFEQFSSVLTQRYLELTRYFVVAQRYRVNIENTKLNPAKVLEGANPQHPYPTTEWITKYRSTFLEKAESDAATDWLSDPAQLDAALGSALTEPATLHLGEIPDVDHIPGKHLLHCLIAFVAVRVNEALTELPSSKLYIRLLNHVDIGIFSKLREAIVSKHPSLA
jgi:hypothetical protein